MTSRTWTNGPSGHTPITAAALMGIEGDLDARPAMWAPNVVYPLGQQAVSPNNDVVSRITAGTSLATYAADAANWALSATFATPTQAAGIGAALSIVFGG